MDSVERKQSWVAAHSGIPPTTLSKVLKETRSIALDQMVAIADVLGMDPAKLVANARADLTRPGRMSDDLRQFISADALDKIDAHLRNETNPSPRRRPSSDSPS